MQEYDIRINKKRISVFVALFACFCFLFVYFIIYSTGIIKGVNKPVDENRSRLISKETENITIEGMITDRNGSAITIADEAGLPAVITDDECFSHIVGYNSARYGKSGLRSLYYNELFNGGKDRIGATLKLTLDYNLQKHCYDLLEGHKGSVSVIDCDTGEIIVLASRSDEKTGYNANIVGTEKEDGMTYFDYYNSIDSFWLNHAVMAQDPPGSIFKVITAASLIENGFQDYTYYDTGKFEVGSGEIKNANDSIYGNCDLQKALTNSVNTYFASAGLELGSAALQNTAEKFLINTPIQLDFATLKSNLDYTGINNRYVVASTAYGQGRLVISPLHLCMIMQSVLNDGVMIKPYLVDEITDNNKTKSLQPEEEILTETILPEHNETLKNMLHNNAVSSNYGFYESEYGYVIAKTGTAEVEYGNGNHVYFVFAVDLGDKKYACCIDYADVSGMYGINLAPTAKNIIGQLKLLQTHSE